MTVLTQDGEKKREGSRGWGLLRFFSLNSSESLLNFCKFGEAFLEVLIH